MSDNAVSASGITVAWSSDDITYTAIGEIRDSELPGPESDEHDISDHSSLYKKFQGGMIDEGEFSCEMNLLPTDTQHKALRAGVGTVYYWRVTLGSHVTTYNRASFRGLLKAFGPVDAPMSGPLRAPLTVKVSGQVTWATA